jgi:hypothetical protein
MRSIHAAAAALMIVAGIAMAGNEKKPGDVALEVELPKPQFKGTPVAVKLPHLEPPRNAARPTFYLPKGCENLAADMEVTSSDDNPIIGEIELVSDDDADARNYVELKPGMQWVQIDLEESYTIYAILVWHYHLEPRAYHDVVVQISDDADFITGVKTVYNNDHDNSGHLGKGSDKAYIETNEGRLMPVNGVKGRYVRLYSNGSTGSDANHYTEAHVYGK